VQRFQAFVETLEPKRKIRNDKMKWLAETRLHFTLWKAGLPSVARNLWRNVLAMNDCLACRAVARWQYVVSARLRYALRRGSLRPRYADETPWLAES
jgi:hypothetical protein